MNVRNAGARGDGTTDDTAVLQDAAARLQPGQALYFPAGRYLIRSHLDFSHKSDIRIYGDGTASSIQAIFPAMHFYLGTDGAPGTGIVVEKLLLAGPAGGRMKDGNTAGGIQVFGPAGTIIRDVQFDWCSSAVYCAGPSKGTIIDNCRVQGWGRMCLFLNGGERVTNCILTQLDPDRNGERTSHGMYIHSGCTDVLVQDVTISNARKYGIQIYGEQLGTISRDIRLVRVTIRDSENGIIVSHSQPSAAQPMNILLDGCQVINPYGGPGISLKAGNGIVVQNCQVTGGAGTGIQLGVWAPWDPNETLSNVTIQDCQVTGCQQGVWALPSAGGQFQNVALQRVQSTGNRQPDSLQGAGITRLP